MLQDIDNETCSANAGEMFSARLREETQLLRALAERDALSQRAPSAGVELEAWLIDSSGRPAAVADAFLAAVGASDVVATAAKFSVELKVPPQPLAGDGFGRLERDLQSRWAACQETAAAMGLRVVAIGVLPSVDDADLCQANSSGEPRLSALSRQLQRLRQDRPCQLDIHGLRERLQAAHRDALLDTAVTSVQAHLQVSPPIAPRFYNAALLASATTVAVAANAPYLFGVELWDDTRLPLLEQAIDVGAVAGQKHEALGRASFGTGYVGTSLVESFQENLDLYPVVLPLVLNEPRARLAHLRLHNSTIWRWNQPRVGFDDDGTAHLRIAHRVMSPGPTLGDTIANLCFYYGLVASLATEPEPPELRLPFDAARKNLYNAARLGLNAEVLWLDGELMQLRSLLLVELLERAHEGLRLMGVHDDIAQRNLGLIERRVGDGQTGAVWQRRFVNAHGRNFTLLMREYVARQLGGRPVHEWNLRRMT